MCPEAEPSRVWKGSFGEEYTDRHRFNFEDFENLYRKRLGITRTEMNRRFLGKLDSSIRILEVGCNLGHQLGCLQRLGFQNLWGVEIQNHAIDLLRSHLPDVRAVQGAAGNLPFRDGAFDLVFTSGVLIHIPPAELPKVLREIHRCSRRFIWGYEYWSEEWTGIPYRGASGLLWKGPFARIYQESLSDLQLVQEEKFNYLEENCSDTMFLFRKKSFLQ